MKDPLNEAEGFCPHCGAPILTEAVFCGNCGKALDPIAVSSADAGILSFSSSLSRSKYFSEVAVLVGSFLGGPLATGLFMWSNYRSLGRHSTAKTALVIGIVSALLLIAIIAALPPGLVESALFQFLPIIYTGIAFGIFELTQKKQIRTALREGGERESVWKIFGFSVLGLMILSLTIYLKGQSNEFPAEDNYTDVSSRSDFTSRAGIDEYNLGCDLQAQGDAVSAERQFKLALEQNPDLAEAYLNLGLIYIEDGRLELGEEMTRKSIQLLERARKTIVLGNTFEQTLSLAYNNMGVIEMDRYAKYNRALEYEDARKSWRRGMDHFYTAQRLDPQNSISNKNIRRFAGYYDE